MRGYLGPVQAVSTGERAETRGTRGRAEPYIQMPNWLAGGVFVMPKRLAAAPGRWPAAAFLRALASKGGASCRGRRHGDASTAAANTGTSCRLPRTPASVARAGDERAIVRQNGGMALLAGKGRCTIREDGSQSSRVRRGGIAAKLWHAVAETARQHANHHSWLAAQQIQLLRSKQ